MEPIDPVLSKDTGVRARSDAESDVSVRGADAVLLSHLPVPLGTGLSSVYRPLRSVIGEVEISYALNTVLNIGRELSDGGWQQSEYVVLAPIEREALIGLLLAQRGICAARLTAGVARNLPEGPLSPAEVVIANHLAGKEQPVHRAAACYAAGIVAGQFAPATDWAQYGSVAAALGAPAETAVLLSTEDGSDLGRRATIGYRQWRIGIGLIHALADGVVADAESGACLGQTTDLISEPVALSNAAFTDTDLTLDGFAHAFGGDLVAAAGAFIRATQALGRAIDLAMATDSSGSWPGLS